MSVVKKVKEVGCLVIGILVSIELLLIVYIDEFLYIFVVIKYWSENEVVFI